MQAQADVVLAHARGLHARPASAIASAVGALDAQVRLTTDTGRSADAKSMLSLLMLAAPAGTQLRVEAEGPQAQEAVDAIVALCAGDFGGPP